MNHNSPNGVISELGPQLEAFLNWVGVRHGNDAMSSCRAIMDKARLWGKPINPWEALNEVLYPKDGIFSPSRVGKIKFVV